MAIYVIGDLHLSFNSDKPMDIFGDNWERHYEKIRNNWIEKVTQEDVVLIPGDISWAMKLEDAKQDLDWINDLPGKKVLLKGNHDYWWSSLNKLNKLYEDMYFIQNNHYGYKDYGICGTRGWLCPNPVKFDEHDEKVYLREANRLRMSLESANKAGYDKYIVMLHYPPTNEQLEQSLFKDIIEEYNVEKVVYGHLHNQESFKKGLKGFHDGAEYFLTSCDYLDFDLLKLL